MGYVQHFAFPLGGKRGIERYGSALIPMDEALILCAVAALLSLLLGLTVGWGFTGWTLAWMPFGGLPTVLVLPWPRLLEGFGLLLAATLAVTPLPICLLIRALLRR